MRKGYVEFWHRLGRLEKAFLIVALLYAVLRLSGLSPGLQFAAATCGAVLGLISLFKWARLGMRKAIWSLRNRLIAAYLFIAFVPIFLILALAYLASFVLMGNVAAYFVRTQLANREQALLGEADRLAGRGPSGRMPGLRGSLPGLPGGGLPVLPGLPGGGRPGTAERGFSGPPGGGRPEGFPRQGAGNEGRGTFSGRRPLPMPAGPGRQNPTGQQTISPEEMLRWLAATVSRRFPNAEVLITGRTEIREPASSTMTDPPAEWGRASGLIVRKVDGEERLYMWAHSVGSGPDIREVTIALPITGDVLSRLDPRLSAVRLIRPPLDTFSSGDGSQQKIPEVAGSPDARIPKRANFLDIPVSGWYPVQVASWRSPAEQYTGLLAVDSRMSAILGIIFEKRSGQQWQIKDAWVAVFVFVITLFILVEIFSLWTGVNLSRSITGAVHELYQGTQHVKEGDFSYRIPVTGEDQLADLTTSFNTMTENLGQLIVVAKEKERLESELEIAREVQNQLFPRDVPSSKSLELKGICKPARVVSGDYYDFMAMQGSELAFAIGDVAGKGISAALLMATIQSTMRTQLNGMNGSTPPHFSAAKLVAQLNRQLYANTTPEKYATFYFAIYDEATRNLTYTNAGHLPPMLVRNGEIIDLNPTGTVVGAFPFAKYEERSIALEDRDILVAYTDGIVEPENPYGEMFGENRLKDLILRNAQAGSSEIIARVMEAVGQWTGSSELQDDMTMIVARRV